MDKPYLLRTIGNGNDLCADSLIYALLKLWTVSNGTRSNVHTGWELQFGGNEPFEMRHTHTHRQMFQFTNPEPVKIYLHVCVWFQSQTKIGNNRTQ